MTRSNRSLSAAVLLILSFSSTNLVLPQSSLNEEDKTDIVRAVLQAELARQVSTFQNVRHLSDENITSLISTRVAANLKLTSISLEEINDKAHSFMGVHYLRLDSFRIEADRAVVTLSLVSEVDPCFGPFRKDQQSFTYSLAKLGRHWKAELTSNPPPSFTFGIEKLTFGKSL